MSDTDPRPSQGLQPGDTVDDGLAKNGILVYGGAKAGKTYGGSRDKLFCPQCHGGKSKERNFYVSVDEDGQGATWICFSANRCGFTGGFRLHGASSDVKRRKIYRRPEPERTQERPDALVAHFAQYGISAETLEAFGVYRTVRRFPVLGETGKLDYDKWEPRPCIAYPYRRDGELVNLKTKTIYPGGLKAFAQERDAEPTMFNIDAFETDDIGYIVEGEDDVLALYEGGFRQITTLPGGSPSKAKVEEYDPENDTDKRYEALRNEPKILNLRKVVLCGDDDPAGRAHMEEIAKRVGKERCWRVTWPGGCKDAKAVLAKLGKQAVFDAVETATPYPIEGIVDIDDEEIANFRAGLDDARLLCGVDEIDEHMSLSDGGSFIVTTGRPGDGKSTVWLSLAVLYVEQAEKQGKDFHVVICAPEMRIKDMVSVLISAHAGRPWVDSIAGPGISIDDILTVHLPWVRRHFTFIEAPDNETPKASWVLKTGRVAVERWRAKLFIVDPWQELDPEYPARGNESRHITRLLGLFRRLATETRCNVVMVAHPSKMKRDKEGKFPVPEGYDIQEGQGFYSVPFTGITVFRGKDDKSTDSSIRVWKARYGRFAKRGDVTFTLNRASKRIYPKPVQAEAGGWRRADSG